MNGWPTDIIFLQSVSGLWCVHMDDSEMEKKSEINTNFYQDAP
jgi:hypothetical protein